MSDPRFIPPPDAPLSRHCISLVEECAELQQAVCKLERFGPNSCHPRDPKRETNIDAVRREFADVTAAMARLEAKIVADEIEAMDRRR